MARSAVTREKLTTPYETQHAIPQGRTSAAQFVFNPASPDAASQVRHYQIGENATPYTTQDIAGVTDEVFDLMANKGLDTRAYTGQILTAQRYRQLADTTQDPRLKAEAEEKYQMAISKAQGLTQKISVTPEELTRFRDEKRMRDLAFETIERRLGYEIEDRGRRDQYLADTAFGSQGLVDAIGMANKRAQGEGLVSDKAYLQSKDDAFRQAMAMAASSRSGSGLAQRQGMHANAGMQAQNLQSLMTARAAEVGEAERSLGQMSATQIGAMGNLAALTGGQGISNAQLGQSDIGTQYNQMQNQIQNQFKGKELKMAQAELDMKREQQEWNKYMDIVGTGASTGGAVMGAMASDARVKDAIRFEDDGQNELDNFMAALSDTEKRRLEDGAMKDKYASNTRGMRGIGASSRSPEDEELYDILKRALPHEARQEEQGVRPVEALSGEEKEDLKDQEDGDGFFAAMKGLFQKRKSDADQAAASASGKELKKATKALGQGAAMMNRANQANGYTPMVGRTPARSQGGWQSSMDAIRAQLGGGGPGRSSGRVSGPIGGGVMPFSFSDRESKMKAHMLDDMMAKTKPYGFEYNEKGRLLQKALGNNPEGRQYGVMAQDLERSPVGRSMVIDTPEGKVVDTNKAAMASLAANARLNERVEGLERGLGDTMRSEAKDVMRGDENSVLRRAEDERLEALGPNIEQGLRDAFFEAMQDLERKKGMKRSAR